MLHIRSNLPVMLCHRSYSDPLCSSSESIVTSTASPAGHPGSDSGVSYVSAAAQDDAGEACRGHTFLQPHRTCPGRTGPPLLRKTSAFPHACIESDASCTVEVTFVWAVIPVSSVMQRVVWRPGRRRRSMQRPLSLTGYARVGLAALYAEIVSRTNFEGCITRRMDWAGGGMTAGCRFSLRGAFTVSAADMEVALNK